MAIPGVAMDADEIISDSGRLRTAAHARAA
jgi:hypothetical protein